MHKSVALMVASVFLWFGTAAHAAIVQSGTSTVMSQSTDSYSSFGNGDVVFQLTTNNLTECYGFWLRATDPGFRNNLAILLAQIQTGGSLNVIADDSQIWTGSIHPYCLVYGLQL